MTTALNKPGNSTFELTLTLPWMEIKSVYDQVFEELAGEIEIEGFRKGKAPREMVAGKVDKNAVYDEVIKRILPQSYAKALEEHHLKPIVNPKVQIISGEENKDWQFIAKAAEKPEVKLGDYKKDVSELNAKGKIWTPASAPSDAGAMAGKPASDDVKEKEKSKKTNEIIEKLLGVCVVEIPELLIESEVNRLVVALLDDIRAAGLTYEQYLASKGATAEQIREQYQKQVVTTLKLEFILEAVADDLNIVVEEKEINAIIEAEADPKRKEALKAQSYYLTSLVRREKTLTKLTVL